MCKKSSVNIYPEVRITSYFVHVLCNKSMFWLKEGTNYQDVSASHFHTFVFQLHIFTLMKLSSLLLYINLHYGLQYPSVFITHEILRFHGWPWLQPKIISQNIASTSPCIPYLYTGSIHQQKNSPFSPP